MKNLLLFGQDTSRRINLQIDGGAARHKITFFDNVLLNIREDDTPKIKNFALKFQVARARARERFAGYTEEIDVDSDADSGQRSRERRRGGGCTFE